MLNREQELKNIQSLPNDEQKCKKLEELVRKYPEYSVAYYDIAFLSYDLKQWDKSKKYYEKTIELNPTHEVAYNNLALLLTNEYFKEYDLARKYFEKLIKLNSSYALAYFNFAILLSNDYFKEYDIARKYYEKTIELNPNHSKAYINLAVLLSSDHFKEFEQARMYSEKAIELNPDYAPAYFWSATLLLNEHYKEYDLAKKNYEKAIELEPNEAGYYNNLAILLAEEHFKEFGIARKLFEKAIELEPNEALSYSNLAAFLYKNLEEPELVKSYLEKGLEINPTWAYLHLNYAEILANYLKDKELAKYHFSKAIELKEDEDISESARLQLKDLAFEGNEPSFISQINVSRILHLKDFSIDVDSKQLKHLLITGHNGCGKTILLNQISSYLQRLIVSKPETAMMNGFEKDLDKDNPELLSIQPSARTLYYKYRSGFFVIAHFEARRNLKLEGIKDVENIQLPTYTDIKAESGDTNYTNKLFLKYAVNQYMQGGLAALRKDEKRQKEIERWIANFENIVKTIDDRIEKIQLVEKPNYHFEFIPKAPYEKFTFEQLADGFASIFSIVAELILRMANKTLTSYEVEGLVLLDEPEAHLHLDIQRKILPMLTKLFPKVQFIVATHSPFILSSLSNAVIFDLEKRIRVEDVSKYSYWGLAESYFDVNQYSESAIKDLKEYEQLVEKFISKKKMELIERNRMEKLRMQFENMPSFFAKELSIKFNQIELKRLSHD